MANAAPEHGPHPLRQPAVIAELARRQPQAFGTTALIKLLYLLKTLRNAPLPYRFSLYTYGPHDDRVLDDLQYAEFLGMVKTLPDGSGHRIEATGTTHAGLPQHVADHVAGQSDNLDWVVREFGSRSPLDLETLSMLVFTDRNRTDRKCRTSTPDLIRTVNRIRPRLQLADITTAAHVLRDRGYLLT